MDQGRGVALLEETHHGHSLLPSPSQLTWTGFAHGEGFDDGEFWKVSEGSAFTMGELEKGPRLVLIPRSPSRG